VAIVASPATSPAAGGLQPSPVIELSRVIATPKGDPMDATRFDQIARRLAGRGFSRRAALVTGGGGVATALLGGAGLRRDHAVAQDATPVAGEPTSFLFVQAFAAGTLVPAAGTNDRFTLTLTGGLGHTIYFADRPERAYGAVPTAAFLKGLNFSPENPPNAALVMDAAPNDIDVVVLELTNPTYDDTTRSATYEARVLRDYERTGVRFQERPKSAQSVHQRFGTTSLFVDGCPPGTVDCVADEGQGDTVYTYTALPECFDFLGDETWACAPCEGSTNGDGQNLLPYRVHKCNAEQTACNGNCGARVYVG
jgi:hypothetical protein